MFNLFYDNGIPKMSAETEVEKLKRELMKAKEEIAMLREALGSNHPLGVRRGGLLFWSS